MKSDVLAHLSKFYGNAKEDPFEFFRNYHNHIEIIKPASMDLERAKLKAIREAMAGYVKRWFAGLPANSIFTWLEFSGLFLTKFWNAEKATQMEYQIISMKQEPGDSFRQYYLRWKENQPILSVLEITDKKLLCRFYAGLKPQAKQMFDNAAGGNIQDLMTDEAFVVLDCLIDKPGCDIVEADYEDVVKRLDNITVAFQKLTTQPIKKVAAVVTQEAAIVAETCSHCQQTDHLSQNCAQLMNSDYYVTCPEEMVPTNAVYSTNIEASPRFPYGGKQFSYRNHPNFSWKDNAPGQTWREERS